MRFTVVTALEVAPAALGLLLPAAVELGTLAAAAPPPRRGTSVEDEALPPAVAWLDAVEG